MKNHHETVLFTEAELNLLDLAVKGRFDFYHRLMEELPQAKSFLTLVRQYEAFISELDGYDFIIEEYDNDLSVRDTLEEALEACELSLRLKAEKFLRAFDNEFFAKTVRHERKNFKPDEGKFDWHAYFPIQPGPSLQEDIDRNAI